MTTRISSPESLSQVKFQEKFFQHYKCVICLGPGEINSPLESMCIICPDSNSECIKNGLVHRRCIMQWKEEAHKQRKNPTNPLTRKDCGISRLYGLIYSNGNVDRLRKYLGFFLPPGPGGVIGTDLNNLVENPEPGLQEETPLSLSVRLFGDHGVNNLEILLDYGANPNYRAVDGVMLPLHQALVGAEYAWPENLDNWVQAARLLLKYGADPALKAGGGNMLRWYGKTAYEIAAESKHPEIESLLNPEERKRRNLSRFNQTQKEKQAKINLARFTKNMKPSAGMGLKPKPKTVKESPFGNRKKNNKSPRRTKK